VHVTTTYDVSLSLSLSLSRARELRIITYSGTTLSLGVPGVNPVHGEPRAVPEEKMGAAEL